MADWTGKGVLVTGGSSGIGLALGRAFASRGAKVALAARRVDLLEEAAATIRAEGGFALIVPTDVTVPEQVQRMVDQAAEGLGGLDVMVNNAGRSMRRPIADTSLEEFRELMELNFFSLVSCTRAALPHLRARKGHLVNISSLAGKSAARYMGAYPATKHAVTAYSQQLRLELAPEGLHVLNVCPGPVDTKVMDASLGANQMDGVPERARKPGAGVKTRALKPEELAEAIVAACESRTGEIIFPGWGRILLCIQQLSAGLGDFIVRAVT